MIECIRGEAHKRSDQDAGKHRPRATYLNRPVNFVITPGINCFLFFKDNIETILIIREGYNHQSCQKLYKFPAEPSSSSVVLLVPAKVPSRPNVLFLPTSSLPTTAAP